MRTYSGKNGVKGDGSPTPYFSIFYVAMQLFAIRLPQTICNVVDIKYPQDRRQENIDICSAICIYVSSFIVLILAPMISITRFTKLYIFRFNLAKPSSMLSFTY